MSAIYMSQLSTALPLMEGDQHQDLHHHHHHHHQGHFQAFSLPKDPPILFPFVISSSDSSLSYGSANDHHHLMMRQQQHQSMLDSQHMIGGHGSSAASVFATPFPTVESIRDDMIEPSSFDPYDMGKLQQVGGSLETAGSWTPPSKMRITRKATADPGAAKKPRRRAAQGYEDVVGMSGGQQQPNHLGVIRVCSDCNTTKTPLWRSGPCGPKSLCNACGIRQRKARRAMMAATGSSGPVSTDGAKLAMATPSRNAMAASAHPKVKKEKRMDVDRSLPFKKRGKVVQDHTAVTAAAPPPAAVHKVAAEVVDAGLSGSSRDLVDSIGLISWSRSPAAPSSAASCSFQTSSSPGLPVQHQDEITDAAMLLMTLSCGLVRS